MNKPTLIILPVSCLFCLATTLFGSTFTAGDIVYGTNQGNTVEWYRNGGLVSTLTPAASGVVAAYVAFDSVGDLYVSQEGNVGRFDTHGNFLGTFATTAADEWGGLVFNKAGDLFAGTSTGSLSAGSGIFEFNSTGGLIHNYLPGTIALGMALEANQNTMLFTDESGTVHSLNLTTGVESTFATVGSQNAGLAILANGDVLVADFGNSDVYLLSSNGTLLKTYSTGISSPDGLAVDLTGASFWVSNYYNSSLAEINLASGAVEQTLNGAGDRAAGLAIYAGPAITAASPEPATIGLIGLALIASYTVNRRAKARTGSNIV